MAETKQKYFWNDLDTAVKAGGVSLVTFLILRSGEGRRMVRQLQRLTGVSLTRASIEGGEALTRLREWGEEERDRILSHGVMAAGAVVLFGLLCIAAAANVPNFFVTDPMTIEAARRGAMAEGLVISALLSGIVILIYGIMATIVPIWAIVTGLSTAGKKAGEVELSVSAIKKAPAWFFGTLSSISTEVAAQIAALYRWFTRLVGWVALSSGYIWAVPFHRAPELLAGLAIPVITVFYAFNQGWRAEKEHQERGPVWKAIIISTALVMLNMAFLASWPAYYEGLLLGHFVPMVVFWVLLLAQIVSVYRWSTAGSSSDSSGGYRRAPSTRNGNQVGKALTLLVIGLIGWGIVGTVLKNEVDISHAPVQIVKQELSQRDMWLPGFRLTPFRAADGSLQYKPGFGFEPPAADGDGHYPSTNLATEALGGNPDSVLVAPNAAIGGWQKAYLAIRRGDTVCYQILDDSYGADSSGVATRIPVTGYRVKGQIVKPKDLPWIERHCLTRNAPYAALVMQLGEGRPQAMLYPQGELKVVDRFIPTGAQQVEFGFNLAQLPAALRDVSGTVRIVIWVERKDNA